MGGRDRADRQDFGGRGDLRGDGLRGARFGRRRGRAGDEEKGVKGLVIACSKTNVK